jgi:hypothetical protein
MRAAKCLSGLLFSLVLVAGVSSCKPTKDENNELDVCKQVTPAPYTDKLHFRVLNEQTGADLLSAETPNRFTLEQLTSWQFCNETHPLEEASDFYKDVSGRDCVVFWFANLSRPHPYSPQECRRVIMYWSNTDTDTLEWTTRVQSSGVPNCDSFEVLEKVFFNSEVVHQVTQDGQTFFPLYKTN